MSLDQQISVGLSGTSITDTLASLQPFHEMVYVPRSGTKAYARMEGHLANILSGAYLNMPWSAELIASKAYHRASRCLRGGMDGAHLRLYLSLALEHRLRTNQKRMSLDNYLVLDLHTNAGLLSPFIHDLGQRLLSQVAEGTARPQVAVASMKLVKRLYSECWGMVDHEWQESDWIKVAGALVTVESWWEVQRAAAPANGLWSAYLASPVTLVAWMCDFLRCEISEDFPLRPSLVPVGSAWWRRFEAWCANYYGVWMPGVRIKASAIASENPLDP